MFKDGILNPGMKYAYRMPPASFIGFINDVARPVLGVVKDPPDVFANG